MEERAMQVLVLSALVTDRLRDLGLSYARAANSMRDPSTGRRVMSHQTLHALANGQREVPPDLDELTALARVLDVDLQLLSQAAAHQYLGLEATTFSSESHPHLFALLAQVSRLSEEQQAMVENVVEVMIKSLGRNGHAKPPPRRHTRAARS